MILTPLQKLPKNVENLGKLIVAKGLKKLPKVKKSSNLVTLIVEMKQDKNGRHISVKLKVLDRLTTRFWIKLKIKR